MRTSNYFGISQAHAEGGLIRLPRLSRLAANISLILVNTQSTRMESNKLAWQLQYPFTVSSNSKIYQKMPRRECRPRYYSPLAITAYISTAEVQVVDALFSHDRTGCASPTETRGISCISPVLFVPSVSTTRLRRLPGAWAARATEE